MPIDSSYEPDLKRTDHGRPVVLDSATPTIKDILDVTIRTMARDYGLSVDVAAGALASYVVTEWGVTEPAVAP